MSEPLQTPDGADAARPGLASATVQRVRLFFTPPAPVVPYFLAIPFTMTDTLGRISTLQRHNGKVLALVFCASWCAPCQWMVAGWNKLFETYGGTNLMVLGCHAKESKVAVQNYVAKHQVKYPSGPVDSRMLWDYRVFSNDPKTSGHLPRVVLIGRDRRIWHEFRYYKTFEFCRDLIEPMLAYKQPVAGLGDTNGR